MTVNALIVSAYDAGTKKSQHIAGVEETPYEIPIYNYVSSVENPLTWGQFTDLNIAYGFDYPFTSAIWWVWLLFMTMNLCWCHSVFYALRYICFFMNKSLFINKLYTLFLHIIPALIIDFLLLCCAQKPKWVELVDWLIVELFVDIKVLEQIVENL